MLQWAKILLFSCATYLAPTKPLMVGAIVVTVLDAITGIMAARKRGEAITACGLRRTVVKSLIYSLAILAAFVAERSLLDSLVPASKLVAGAVGVVELRSVLANCTTVLGQNVFSLLMSKLGSPPPQDPRKDDVKREPQV